MVLKLNIRKGDQGYVYYEKRVRKQGSGIKKFEDHERRT